jgi:hypothetical protein
VVIYANIEESIPRFKNLKDLLLKFETPTSGLTGS